MSSFPDYNTDQHSQTSQKKVKCVLPENTDAPSHLEYQFGRCLESLIY